MVFRDEFNNRLAEVNKYFDFLEKIESEYKILMNHSKTLSFTIDDELLKILKANGFLILYNLIEATILNSIIAIFDEIKVDNLIYAKVSEKIKKYWFKNKYKHSDAIKDENLNNKFYILVEEVISNITLEIIKDRIEYGGNIDARRIKEISDSLGINLITTHYKKENHGEALLKICKKRNDLAHGVYSFSDIGKDITYNGTVVTSGTTPIITNFGLKHFKQFTEEHLEKYIESVENFIRLKSYKQISSV